MNDQSFSAAVNPVEHQTPHAQTDDFGDSVGLSTQFEQLNLRNDFVGSKNHFTNVTSAPPSTHESSSSNSKKLRFRCKPDSQPRKSIDSTTAIRKKSHNIVKGAIIRPRALSLNSVQIRSGRFGAVCRKMFMQRRRRSFSETSKSEDEAESSNDTEQQPSEAQPGSSDTNVQASCGQEASTAADFVYSIESGEVDELAEYFGHFVNVRLKMSNMAESMYV